MMNRALTAAALLIILLMIALTATTSYQADAQVEPTYVYSTYEAPPTPLPAPGGGAPNDGRLNWAADEYYTLYCAFDQLEVWRGVPSGMLLTPFNLTDLLALRIGGSVANGGVTVTRSNEDIFIVSGANGNTAPNPGSKWFSLSECFSRNGGVPAAPEPPPPPPANTDGCTNSLSRNCFNSTPEFCQAHMTAGTSPLPAECTAAVVDAVQSTAQNCCSIPLFGLVLVPLAWRRKRKSTV